MSELPEYLRRIRTLAELEAALGPLTAEEQALLDAMDAPDYFERHPLTPEEQRRAEQVSRAVWRLMRERGYPAPDA